MNVPAAIITGTMARPSRPSVKFTALAAPAITTPPTMMKKMPNGMRKDLKNGTASAPLSGESSSCIKAQVAMKATPNSTTRRMRPLTPPELRFVTF